MTSSLPLVDEKLTAAGLRERIKLIASGKMVNPAGVAAALCLGADVVCSARGFMFSLGCIQALQCNENTAPPASLPTTLSCEKDWIPRLEPIGSPTMRSRCEKRLS